jgi:hypothetical protein
MVFDALENKKVDSSILQKVLMQMSSASAPMDRMPSGWVRVWGEKKWSEKAKVFLRYIFLLPRLPYEQKTKRSLLLTVYYLFRRLIYLIKQYLPGLWQSFSRSRNETRDSDQESILLRWLQS